MGRMINFAEQEKVHDLQEQYINQLYKNGEYQKCYDSCEYLLSLLPEDKKAHTKLKKFCYLRQAVCKRKMVQYTEAMEKADMALKYCGNAKDDYYSIMHLKAIIYKKTDDSRKALSCLNKCIKWYKINNMHYELAMMYDMKGDLIKSEKLLLESLKEYNAAYTESKYFDKDILQKEIDNVYQRLIELYIYIGEQNMLKSYRALNNIKTESTRQESMELIKNLYCKEVE